MTPHGTRAVIIGNGSSVDRMPPEFWCQDVLYIGTNRALCLNAMQGVRLDAMVIRDTYRSLWHKIEIGWQYHEDFWKPFRGYKVGPSDRRTVHCDEFVRQVPGWQYKEVRDRNDEAAICRNVSVSIMACNVAWLWGVRDFQLAGVDYCGDMAQMSGMYDVSTGDDTRYARPVPPSIERAFTAMRNAIEKGGGSIVNCSPGTKLQCIGCSKEKAGHTL
ncbi:MAG: hypothetical protein GY807_18945 [Gammaproteobacteria bacterium]|nr:hypothetical protein [Gammaproteobacteria bacterium]